MKCQQFYADHTFQMCPNTWPTGTRYKEQTHQDALCAKAQRSTSHPTSNCTRPSTHTKPVALVCLVPLTFAIAIAISPPPSLFRVVHLPFMPPLSPVPFSLPFSISLAHGVLPRLHHSFSLLSLSVTIERNIAAG